MMQYSYHGILSTGCHWFTKNIARSIILLEDSHWRSAFRKVITQQTQQIEHDIAENREVTKKKRRPRGRLSIKMSSYQYRDPHVKDKAVSLPSYL